MDKKDEVKMENDENFDQLVKYIFQIYYDCNLRLWMANCLQLINSSLD